MLLKRVADLLPEHIAVSVPDLLTQFDVCGEPSGVESS